MAKGLVELPTAAPQSYYKLLLKGKMPAQGLTDAEYQVMLKDAGDDENIDFALEDAAPAIEDEVHDGGEVLQAINDAIDVYGAPRRPPAPLPALADAEPAELAELLESDEEVLEAADGGNEIPYPKEVLNGKLWRGFVYSHPAYFCKCTFHTSCKKARQMGVRQTSTHGAWEPIAFLATWAADASSWGTAREHINAWVPNMDLQREWLAGRGLL